MNRTQVENFINTNFAGIAQDYPWEDTPEYVVFRHTDNHKWFALIMNIRASLIGLDSQENIDIINLKSDPDLIETILQEPGIYPAYHMNKRHWITVVLDQSFPTDKLMDLIDISYQLTAKKSRTSAKTS